MSRALFGPQGSQQIVCLLSRAHCAPDSGRRGSVDPCSDLQAIQGRVCLRCMHAYQSAGGRDWVWPGARHSHGLSRKESSQNLPCFSLSMW